jgi:NAD(P)-dependent dehydrogenase (short-subunit alcohol dehydrogenase family)
MRRPPSSGYAPSGNGSIIAGGQVDVVMDGQFQGRVVVVTGGARGIGDAIIDGFVTRGGRAVSIDPGEPEQPRPATRYLSGDVRDRAAVERAFEDVDAHEGRVDVLVNNAGIQRVGLTDEMDPATWQSVIDVHLLGTWNCSAVALRRMKRQGSGAIVSIASVAGLVALPGRGPYSAAKAALMSLTRVMAVEVAGQGIRVNAVAPGFTRTPLVEQGLRDGSLREDWMIGEVPMRRLASASEIANVVRFLASDEASYVTGHTLVVDGGWTIQGIHQRPDWLESGSS